MDTLAGLLAPYYSSTGRPALHQAEIFHFLILMMEQRETSITRWIDLLASDDLLALLIGCPLTFCLRQDLIMILYIGSGSVKKSSTKPHENIAFTFQRMLDLKSSLGKVKSLPTNTMILSKSSFPLFLRGRIPLYIMKSFSMRFFSLIAVVPSIDIGLIPYSRFTISGDRTCVHCHSFSFGIKV